AESIGPAGGQQSDQKAEADDQIADLQPAAMAIVLARLRRIGLEMAFCDGHCFGSCGLNSTVTNFAGLELLFNNVWVKPLGTQASPPGAFLTVAVLESVWLFRSRSLIATTRCGRVCVCSPRREEAGICTSETCHWSATMRR